MKGGVLLLLLPAPPLPLTSPVISRPSRCPSSEVNLCRQTGAPAFVRDTCHVSSGRSRKKKKKKNSIKSKSAGKSVKKRATFCSELAAKSIAPKYQKGGSKCPCRCWEFCSFVPGGDGWGLGAGLWSERGKRSSPGDGLRQEVLARERRCGQSTHSSPPPPPPPKGAHVDASRAYTQNVQTS